MYPMDTVGRVNWPASPHRQRRALVVVDVVESVRLMQQHEADVIDRWRGFVAEVREQVLAPRAGRLVKSLGDGMLLEFDATGPALAAALDLQRRIAAWNRGRDPAAWLCLRAGVHVADVVVDDTDVYGSGVNLAARLASLAAPGEIVASDDVHAAAVPGLDPDFEDLGLCHLKHLAEPVRAYRLLQTTPPDGAARLPADALDRRPVLAVLPIALRGGADAQSLTLADVLSDGIAMRLCASPHVRLISRLSVQALRGRDLALTAFGQLLGARYVLSGRMDLPGARFVATLELAEVASGDVLWMDRVHGAADDLLQPDDPHTQQVAEGALQALAEAELRRVRTLPLPSLEGYAMQVGASMLMHRPALPDFLRAREVLDELIERHPRAPSPRAWLAQWHVLRATRGISREPASEAARAIEQTRRALDADPGSAFALTMEAFVACHLQGDLDLADRRLDDALALNPNEALAWLVRCVAQGFRGNGEAAWAAAQRALALSPLDPQRHYFDALAASAAVAAHRLDDAVRLAQRSLRGNRNHLPTLRALAVAQAERGDLDAARLTALRVLELEPRFTLRDYLARGPRGAEATRERYAQAMRRAGVPD
jgi:adenylate cyclase